MFLWAFCRGLGWDRFSELESTLVRRSPLLPHPLSPPLSPHAPGHLLMICARVSLGRVGNPVPQGRIAPTGFQSVGDGGAARASQIYAVFDNFQAYPEWVIVYDPRKVGPNGNNGQGVSPAGAAASSAAAAAAAFSMMASMSVPTYRLPKSRGRRR